MLEEYKLFCITFRSNDTGRDYNYSCVAKTAEKAIEMFRKKNGDGYHILKVQSQIYGRIYNHKEQINNIKVKEETKMMNISKEVIERTNLYWNEITGYMADDIREWTHSRYCEEQNWKFLKEYFLHLISERGEEEGEAFDTLLWQEFNIDIDDLVTYDEKQEAIADYESTNN